jgi:ferredoxin/flavodoxin---NADP+ reductase
VSELAYGEELVARLRDDEFLGPLLTEKLLYYPTVTREPFRNRGRITDLITSISCLTTSVCRRWISKPTGS